ncbi:hypothetical protein ACFRQM_51605, partial [Streptomyces sp. NPDC056831]|uniref:hypothetical protein n=1 Tax=Streptomyces sp. NPDC056831 TaxID=3345954 RepID=UPI00368C4F56
MWHENQEKERQNSIVTVCGQTRNAYGQLAASYSIHGLGKDSNGTRRAFAHQVDEAAGATSDSKLAKLLKSQSADTSGYADAVERNDKTAVQRYTVPSQSSAQALLDYCRAKASIDVYWADSIGRRNTLIIEVFDGTTGRVDYGADGASG